MCNCNILHDEDEACPKRIATALRYVEGQSVLNDADRKWITNHPAINFDIILEGWITRELVSDKLRVISESQEARKEAGSILPCQLCSQYDGDGIHFNCRVGIKNCINKGSKASRERPIREGKARSSNSEVVSNKGWEIPDSVVEEALQ